MGFLSKFEGRMEDTVEGAADRMAGAPISPVQIAKKAEKQMRREKMVGAGKQYAPTLYTVLVNPEDDQRLFGYYPTLSGEIETYLAAKATEQGLAMDGQPLVRFIVDDDLKQGKFDVIAEAVASPIVEQLRAEEMQRYGLAPQSGAYGARGRAAAQGGYAQAQPRGGVRGAPPARGAAAVWGGAAGAGVAAGAAGAVAAGAGAYSAEQGGAAYDSAYDNAHNDAAYFADSYDGEDALFNQPLSGGAYPAAAGAMGAAGAAAGVAGAAGAAAAGAAGAAGAVVGAADAPRRTANTVVFAGADQAAGPAAAAGVAAAGAANLPPARLLDTSSNRAYSLGAARLSIGRESKNDIVVADINASRSHAELTRDAQGNWYLTDLGSTNGTLINGYEVASQMLEEGDRITIGTTNFMFSYRG